ncbi:MAG TPA: hypothetical protein VFR31_09930 [Thermoanaerobaculia bacterium]|nr:hypothetical protein [Thermoanaerobaculia bacterium]
MRTTIFLMTLLLAACDQTTASVEPAADPLASEIGRWSKYLESRPPQDELRQNSEPAVDRAEESLAQGKRLLATHRIVMAWEDLAANNYLRAVSANQRKEMAAFETEWARMGGELRPYLGSASLGDLHPAAVRALGEAAFPQVRAYYDASIEQGRATSASGGFYYLGAAQGQREVVDFLRKVSEPTTRKEPPLRSLAPEIETLEGEMMAIYRPPVSIDRHGEFITASATLKEARELDEAGLRYGALLRYLQAALQFAPLRGAKAPLLPEGALAQLESRLSAGDMDQSIGQLFLESAQAHVASGSAEGAAGAAIIAGDILPRYFAALEPARPQAPRPEPRVTVTLVRWPYT